jgi:hypothetical protein
MTKQPRRPVTKKIRRNPLAREVRTAKFRERVVPRADTYRRRPKYPVPPTEET